MNFKNLREDILRRANGIKDEPVIEMIKDKSGEYRAKETEEIEVEDCSAQDMLDALRYMYAPPSKRPSSPKV